MQTYSTSAALNTSSWEGIPGHWIEDPTAIDGRRFIASRHAIARLRARMRDAANGRCEECGATCWYGERHHVWGRGCGSGKREDRWKIGGIRPVLWLCHDCHSVAVIKPWGSWKNCEKLEGAVEDEHAVDRFVND